MVPLSFCTDFVQIKPEAIFTMPKLACQPFSRLFTYWLNDWDLTPAGENYIVPERLRNSRVCVLCGKSTHTISTSLAGRRDGI